LQSLNPLKRVNSILTEAMSDFEKELEIKVSIPSNGSIQFLQKSKGLWETEIGLKSQSPQTGQFNSYPVRSFFIKE